MPNVRHSTSVAPAGCHGPAMVMSRKTPAGRPFIPAEAVAQLTPYTVKRGDNLTRIAGAQPVELLINANPGLANPNRIQPGQVIDVPVLQANTHVVRPAETLSGIAEDTGIWLSLLQRVNPQIADWNRIYAGEVLFLPTEKDQLSFMGYVAFPIGQG